jgi:RHS repeat-associated protein
MRLTALGTAIVLLAACGGSDKHSPAVDPQASPDAGNSTVDVDSGSEVTPADSGVTFDAAVDVATDVDAGPPITSTAYTYGQQGELLGEYDEDGNTLQELVYLEGRVVGVIRDGKVNAVQTDQLGAPRAVLSGGQTVWQWDPEPFGATPPNEDVDKDGKSFVFNERFPGQRFDPVSTLYQNFHRNYAADLARYIEADPIGLGGGSNGYLYASGNPVQRTDPLGLQQREACGQACQKEYSDAMGGESLLGAPKLPSEEASGQGSASPGANATPSASDRADGMTDEARELLQCLRREKDVSKCTPQPAATPATPAKKKPWYDCEDWWLDFEPKALRFLRGKGLNPR